MNVPNFEELKKLLVTEQIKQKILPKTRESFIKELPKIKEVDELVEKLDDFDSELRGCQTAKLHKAQNWMNREERVNKRQQNAHWNNIR